MVVTYTTHIHDYKQLSIIFCDNLSKWNNHTFMQIKIVVVVVLLIFKTFLNNIIMASHSNKNKKWKIKDLTTE